MKQKYSIIAFIIMASSCFTNPSLYASPVAYTESDFLTPLDPVGKNVAQLQNTNTKQNSGREKPHLSPLVRDAYKRNLMEAMGKKLLDAKVSSTPKTIEQPKVTTSTKVEASLKPSEKTSQKSDPNVVVTKAEPKKQDFLPKNPNEKEVVKTEIKPIIQTEETKYKPEPKDTIQTEKKSDASIKITTTKPNDASNDMVKEAPEKETKTEEKIILQANPNKESTKTEDQTIDPKTTPRKQAYEGARPQLWYGGPWRRG